MSLRRRTPLRAPGMPEAFGVTLLAAAGFCALMALFEFHKPVDVRAGHGTATEPMPLTEEGLRRVLREMSLSFQYQERSVPAEWMSEDRLDGPKRTGPASPIIDFSEGDGTLRVAMRPEKMVRAIRSAGMAGWTSAPDAPRYRSWAAVAILAYVAALYYFAAMYPSRRRTHGAPGGLSEGRMV